MGSKPKIAILTHFNSFQPSYALATGWHERARMFQYHNQDFDFLVNTTCPEGLYPNQKSVLTRVEDGDMPFDDKVLFFRKNYRKVLREYDVILTADLIYQSKGSFLAWNQAMRDVDKDFKAQGMTKRWYHWIHSAWTDHITAKYPESLRYTYMDGSTLVYMNESERAGVSAMYHTDPKNVACVYNPKDYRSFNEFQDLSWEITSLLDIPNKDYVQIFPHCATRMDAKGLMPVIDTFAALKRAGKSVALILANGNARSVQFQIQRKKEYMAQIGLVENEDYVFTHDLTERFAACPRRVVSDLFKVSNVFVFASWREVCPNVLLEAKITGNLLVVNENLPQSREFAGDDAVFFRSTVKIPGMRDRMAGDKHNDRKNSLMTEQDCDDLAQQIIKRAPSRKHLWEFSFDNIWEKQMRPLLYG